MRSSLLMRLEGVRRAETEEEKGGIYRLRYEISGQGDEEPPEGADHARGWVLEEEDEAPNAHHFYTGRPGAPTAAVRVRVWPAGQVPEATFKALSMDRLPGVECLRVAEHSGFLIKPSHRKLPLLPSLAYETYKFCAGEAKTDLAFYHCPPTLVEEYQRLGARPYSARTLQGRRRAEVPLVSILSDHAYYKQVNSPMAPLVGYYFKANAPRSVDLELFLTIFESIPAPIITERQGVWAAMQSALLGDEIERCSFLEMLPAEVVEALSRGGFVLNLAPGEVLVQEGDKERELSVVLEGQLEVVRRDEIIARIGAGEVVGELAFFRMSGERAATVRAAGSARVVTLRREFLDQLSRSNPTAAYQLVLNLARILAERLAASI